MARSEHQSADFRLQEAKAKRFQEFQAQITNPLFESHSSLPHPSHIERNQRDEYFVARYKERKAMLNYQQHWAQMNYERKGCEAEKKDPFALRQLNQMVNDADVIAQRYYGTNIPPMTSSNASTPTWTNRGMAKAVKADPKHPTYPIHDCYYPERRLSPPSLAEVMSKVKQGAVSPPTSPYTSTQRHGDLVSVTQQVTKSQPHTDLISPTTRVAATDSIKVTSAHINNLASVSPPKPSAQKEKSIAKPVTSSRPRYLQMQGGRRNHPVRPLSQDEMDAMNRRAMFELEEARRKYITKKQNNPTLDYLKQFRKDQQVNKI